MEDFILAQNAGMWDSDLQTLNKALIHAKDGLIRQPEQLTMEVKLQIWLCHLSAQFETHLLTTLLIILPN